LGSLIGERKRGGKKTGGRWRRRGITANERRSFTRQGGPISPNFQKRRGNCKWVAKQWDSELVLPVHETICPTGSNGGGICEKEKRTLVPGAPTGGDVKGGGRQEREPQPRTRTPSRGVGGPEARTDQGGDNGTKECERGKRVHRGKKETKAELGVRGGKPGGYNQIMEEGGTNTP